MNYPAVKKMFDEITSGLGYSLKPFENESVIKKPKPQK